MSSSAPATEDVKNGRNKRIEVSPKTFLWLVLTVAACWLLVQLAAVVLSVVVALFIVGTFGPIVEWLERKHIRRNFGIPLVFFLSFALGVAFCALTLPTLIDQGQALVQHEPELRAKLADKLAESEALQPASDWLRNIDYAKIAKPLAASAWLVGTRAFELIAYAFGAIFLALYLMFDRDRVRGGLFAVVPREYHLRLSRVLIQLESIIGGYIRGQALTSALMTVFVLILLTITGVPNALAVAVFAGLADVLPYIGVVLTVLPAAAAASQSGTTATIVVVVALLAYEELESRVLIPRIYGRAMRLPSSMVLLALMTGGTLMGIGGALLALPIAAAIRMLIEEWRVDLPGEPQAPRAQVASDARAEHKYEARSDGKPAEEAAAIAVEMSERQLEQQKKRAAPGKPEGR